MRRLAVLTSVALAMSVCYSFAAPSFAADKPYDPNSHIPPWKRLNDDKVHELRPEHVPLLKGKQYSQLKHIQDRQHAAEQAEQIDQTRQATQGKQAERSISLSAPPSETLSTNKDTNEAARLLIDYLKIDTTNPPGNEKAGAEYLASVLRKNGIEAQILDTAPGRACVYARLKGSGKNKAIVLLNHIDVVPAEAKDWQHPPFGGEVHKGEIWGRGALDMKGMGIVELQAMLMLKRSGVKLDRDIIFLGTPDEEVGGEAGAKWFVEHHKELIKDAEFLINEGYHIDAKDDGTPKFWGVNVAEKSVLWLKLTAKGDAGHASMPIRNSAPNRLSKALEKVVANPPAPVVVPMVQQFFTDISAVEDEPLKGIYKNIQESVKNSESFAAIEKADKMKASMLRNTVSLTVMKSGYKTNVIPAEAYAELDCRLLPGVLKDDFIAQIKKIVADPSIEISVLEWEKAEGSPQDTELFKAIKAVAAAESAKMPVVPVVVPWFTDSHWFREAGLVAYGFEPVEMDALHIATVHGKDERMPIATLGKGVERLHKILLQLAQAK